MPLSDMSIIIESSFTNCLRACKLAFGCTHVSYAYTNIKLNQKGSCWLKKNAFNQISAIGEIGFTSAILNQGIEFIFNNIAFEKNYLNFYFSKIMFFLLTQIIGHQIIMDIINSGMVSTALIFQAYFYHKII